MDIFDIMILFQMKKKKILFKAIKLIVIFFVLLLSNNNNLFAQLSKTHYIPPLTANPNDPFTDQYIYSKMMEALKNFGGKKLGGVILIAVIVIAFGFGGFGGGFSTNNQNNIAKINRTNVTTQDFMDYLNQSNISQQAIRENLDKNIIEELLSGLISTTLIDLEVEDFDLSITDLTVLKKIKENISIIIIKLPLL